LATLLLYSIQKGEFVDKQHGLSDCQCILWSSAGQEEECSGKAHRSYPFRERQGKIHNLL